MTPKQKYLDAYSRAENLKAQASQIMREAKADFIASSEYQIGDKVEYRNRHGYKSDAVKVGFIFEIGVFSNDLSYTVTPPKKDGTMSSRGATYFVDIVRKLS